MAGAGVVLDVGTAVKNVHKSDHVLLSYNHCGDCESCNGGHPAYCYKFTAFNFGQKRTDGSVTMRTLDGKDLHGCFFGQSSFSRIAIVSATCVVKVPTGVDLSLLAPLGCGLQTGAGAVLNTLDVKPGSSLAVFGAGSVGMSAIMAGKLRGAKIIIAIDLQQERLHQATEVGATHVILGSKSDLVAQIQKICPPGGVQYAVDCTGVPQVVEKMIESLGTRGRAATVGAPTPGKRASVDIFSHLLMGREYVGCCEGDSIAEQVIDFSTRPWTLKGLSNVEIHIDRCSHILLNKTNWGTIQSKRLPNFTRWKILRKLLKMSRTEKL